MDVTTLESLQLPLFWLLLCLLSGAFASLILTISKTPYHKVPAILTLASIVVAFLILLLRGLIMYAIPFSNGMDFSLWFIILVLGMYLYGRKRHQWAFMGALLIPMTGLLAVWMLQLDMQISPLQPALRSVWLIFHVSCAVVAYATFAMSFVFAMVQLFTRERSRVGLAIPPAEQLDHWSYKQAMIGLPFLTIMLITGAVWAEYAWGKFWSWDPKETWALITWLVYAAYLHLRLRGWSGKNAAILNVVGFATVIFTFFGVSYLLPGLHSYL